MSYYTANNRYNISCVLWRLFPIYVTICDELFLWCQSRLWGFSVNPSRTESLLWLKETLIHIGMPFPRSHFIQILCFVSGEIDQKFIFDVARRNIKSEPFYYGERTFTMPITYVICLNNHPLQHRKPSFILVGITVGAASYKVFVFPSGIDRNLGPLWYEVI